MTNDELKKKIAQIIADYFCPQGNEHKSLWGDDRLCYSKMNFAECEWVAECTDALIAAGIGDVSELKNHRIVAEYSLIPEDGNNYFLPNTPLKIKQLYSGEEVEQIVKEKNDYKRRAERAEKALRDALEMVIGEFGGEPLEEEVKSALEQAEKELAEELKNERL